MTELSAASASVVKMAAEERHTLRAALLLFGYFTWFLRFSAAMEVTLLDTRKEQSLDWETFSRTASSDESAVVGWRERSYNLENGETTRVYTVCNVELENVDNWLRTPYISLGDANTLWIEIRFTMRKCDEYPDPKQLQQCKESFKLLYYEAESDFANHVLPTWDTSTYRHVDVIAADQTFQHRNDAVVNTERRTVDIKRQGVYFALHDQGACTAVLSLRIYYILCPSVTLHFATFEDTPAGSGILSIVQKEGTCVGHAAIEKPPSYLCKADGAWYLFSGGCKCMPGYEPEGDKKCTPCPPGKYKWNTGTYACAPCPEHSIAPNNGSVECHCVENYYRNIKDDKAMACTRPPSEIRNLTVTYVGQTMVNLSWEHPADLGGRRDISYTIACMGCPPTVIYRPSQRGFNITKASLLGLSTSTKYKIILTAGSGVSSQSNIVRSSSVVVTTQAAVPTQVRNLRVVNIGSSHITIAWEHPYMTSPGPINPRVDTYEIRYYPQVNNANFSTVLTDKQNFTFKPLALETAYAFSVRVKTSRGWGDYSPPITARTGDLFISDPDDINKVNAPTDNPVGIIAGSAVAVVVCMVIVIIMLIIFLRRSMKEQGEKFSPTACLKRNHRACNEKNVSDCDTLQYSNVQCPPVLDTSHMSNGGLTVPLFAPPGSLRTYIDPHTYEDPNQAVREFTKEIDASLITIESVIGGGEFGDVCKGKLRVPGKGELTVAIKTLKAGASDKNRLDFLTEASIMGQFDDPNVIYLEGVVTKSNPIMIVTEFMENGSLDQFLRNNDGKFTVIQLTGMMRGIAAGMKYLSEMGYVHRDLAARNTLVNESLVCKVADFGLSREIESDTTEGAYTTKGGKIPVRWTAPEAIAYRKFTSASDVWSYGVVMWEVMSYGERPYWNWSNQDVIKAVEKGFRLPPPMDCPEAIHQLMLDCWQKERSHRPKFSAIVKTLDKLIRAPELLRKIAKARPHNYFDPNVADLTSYESVEEWLTSIKMERYTDHFLQAGYNTMEVVANLSLKDLTALGVTLVGHQKKIINSIQTLRAQLCDAQVSEGFLV